MTATNHALTGAVIGLLVGQPLIAVPAAFASHFVCDALPHFGSQLPPKILFKSKGFRNYLIVDAGLCVVLVAVLAAVHPEHWLLASVCAFTATSPDLIWAERYFKIRRGRNWKPNLFARFSRAIQWFQRPIGALVEAAWLVAAVRIVAIFLR